MASHEDPEYRGIQVRKETRDTLRDYRQSDDFGRYTKNWDEYLLILMEHHQDST